MGRLTALKTSLQRLPSAVSTLRSGDQRIRGGTLQTIRARILTRDRGVCQCEECKRTGAVKLATIVDHIVPLWAGGTESDHNRQAINVDCHARKSALEARQRASAGTV